MFDEKQNEQTKTPQASAQEPVDMFAGTTEKNDVPAPSQPQVGTMYEETVEDNEEVHESSGRRHMILAIIAVIALLLIIGVGVSLFFFFQKSSGQQVPQDVLTPPVSETQPTPSQEEQPVSPPQETPAPTEEQPQEETPQAPAAIDADNDGLTDVEEQAAGTNSSLPDTDGDGLIDREEVQVYKTNPLSADSDSDGYLDKEEIDNGFNPSGSGKLPTLPTQ